MGLYEKGFCFRSRFIFRKAMYTMDDITCLTDMLEDGVMIKILELFCGDGTAKIVSTGSGEEVSIVF